MAEKHFACPYCQQEFTLPDDYRDLTFTCPQASCGRLVSVASPRAHVLSALAMPSWPRPAIPYLSPGVPVPQTPPPPPGSELAAYSLGFGLVAFATCHLGMLLALIGVFLGTLALWRAQLPATRRKARLGIAASCAGLLVSLWVAYAWAEQGRDRTERYYRYRCADRNLHQVGTALLLYSGDNQGAFPATLPLLDMQDYPGYHGKIYRCPSVSHPLPPPDDSPTAGELVTDYDYYGAGLQDDVAQADVTILAADRATNHPRNSGWFNLLFVDGHVDHARAHTMAEVLAQHPAWRLGIAVAKDLAAARPSSTRAAVVPP